jgi:hypothetical protein
LIISYISINYRTWKDRDTVCTFSRVFEVSKLQIQQGSCYIEEEEERDLRLYGKFHVYESLQFLSGTASHPTPIPISEVPPPSA